MVLTVGPAGLMSKVTEKLEQEMAGQRRFLTPHCELGIVTTARHLDTSMSVNQPVHF